MNTAALMESNGAPGRINISETVAGHVKTLFELEPRGTIVAKHDRSHEMFFLNRLKRNFRATPKDARRTRPSPPNATGC